METDGVLHVPEPGSDATIMETDANPPSSLTFNVSANDVPSFAFSPAEHESEYYNMFHAKRGKAYILNHKKFTLSLLPRDGSDVDRDALQSSLQHLDFDVTCYEDLTIGEINLLLQDLADENHTDRDCLLIAVLTHGDDGGILYAKDRGYKAENLWSRFTSDQCPTLAGKPKIFFIQACQGTLMDAGTTLLPREMGMDCTDGPVSNPVYSIPTHADFLIAFSSLPGYASWRNTSQGSWFIQSLAFVLKDRGQRDDLLSMMTNVSRLVATEFESKNPMDANQDKRKQIPWTTSLLTRKINFIPKTKTSVTSK